MPTYKPLRVNPETLQQLEQLTEASGQTAREVLQDAIQSAWALQFDLSENDSEDSEGILLEEDSPTTHWVLPKSRYKKAVIELVEHSDPIKVMRVMPSWAGYSDGVYKLENCPVPLPVTWFHTAKEPKFVTTRAFFIGWIILQIIFQVAFAILLTF